MDPSLPLWPALLLLTMPLSGRSPQAKDIVDALNAIIATILQLRFSSEDAFIHLPEAKPDPLRPQPQREKRWRLRFCLTSDLYAKLTGHLRTVLSQTSEANHRALHVFTLAAIPSGEEWESAAMQAFDALSGGKVRASVSSTASSALWC